MKRLKQVSRHYNKHGWQTRFMHRVVWVVDNDKMSIFTDDTNANEDWAAGILPTKIPNKSKMSSFDVPTIDIARWFRNTIQLYRPSVVMVKMDIEGSEYDVLPHLLRQGLLCSDKITYMSLEVHRWAKGKHKLRLSTFRKELAKQDCVPTHILDIDDESYLHDPHALS